MKLLFTILTILCVSTGIMAQNTVTGTVTSAQGDPLIGVNVVEKGNSSNGTVTDIDGKYSLSVSPQATLEFSYIGYTTSEIAVNGQSVIDVTLDEGIGLEEVVVTALGIERE